MATNTGQKLLRAIAMLLLLAPVWSGIITAVMIAMAFYTLGNATGPNRDLLLSQTISVALWATIIGFALCPFGFLLRMIARRVGNAAPTDVEANYQRPTP
jgi:ABC-type spermidine/putrescine transport system permease subunit II